MLIKKGVYFSLFLAYLDKHENGNSCIHFGRSATTSLSNEEIYDFLHTEKASEIQDEISERFSEAVGNVHDIEFEDIKVFLNLIWDYEEQIFNKFTSTQRWQKRICDRLIKKGFSKDASMNACEILYTIYKAEDISRIAADDNFCKTGIANMLAHMAVESILKLVSDGRINLG